MEDNVKLSKNIKKGLEQEGFAVDVIEDGNVASRQLAFDYAHYDLIVLDIMLPGKDGLMLCRELRHNGVQTPVLFLTAKDGLDEKIEGLDIGGDDYLVKPFDFPELVARIRALLRRPAVTHATELVVNGITLNQKTHKVTRFGKHIELTTKEFSILEQFMLHPGEALSREHIVAHVWDFAFDGMSNVVDAHIKNLRKKLQKKNEDLFETIHGVGYALNS